MSRKLALGLVASLLTAASPAAADWLVVRAGGRVETRGPWQVKGKLVVFTQADGALSSLRLADVDLDASREATAEAKAKVAAPPAPPPVKKKLATLTDKDFRRPAAAAPEGPAEGEAEKKEKEAQAAAPPATVTVATWRRLDRPSGDGIEIQGTLQNNSDKIAANAGIEVQLFNEAGERVATAPGILNSPSIQPKGAVEFRASFPGVFGFAEARFETRGWPLDISPAEPPEEENPQ